MLDIYKRLKLPVVELLVIEIFIFFFILPKDIVKAETLLVPADYINDDTVNTANVHHNVSFIIPPSGHSLVNTDYIRIIFTNFTNVTSPTSGNGWSGVPVFSVNGNVALITGVTANAGLGIAVGGITATNPASLSDYDVTIQIVNDAVGTIVYDSADINAQAIKGINTVSVSVGTYTSSIEFFGYTSPSAFITILLNGTVGGTIVADSGGNFHKQITGLLGDENFSVSIFAQDILLRQTQTVSFIVHTIPFNNVIISNIVIPTTIALDKTFMSQGDLLEISGYAHPFSQVAVFIETYSSVVQAEGSGSWSYDFNSNTNPLGVGSHITYGKEVVVGGYESVFTQTLTFTVSYCKIADLNCDGFVNLTDFSILMFYWNQSYPSNPRADINGDDYVDLIDFSIMLYYWTG